MVEPPLSRCRPTVVHLLDAAARERPDALALVCGDDRLRYRDYAACVAGLALELRSLGIGVGARVALLMANSADIAIATFGVQAAGAQVVPLNPAYTASELGPMLVDAEPALVLCDAGVVPALDRAGAVDPALAALPRIVIGAAPGMRRLTAWRGRPQLADRLPLPDPEQLSTLQYTGGTTGRSKGVELLHAAVAVNVSQREALVSTTLDDERVLVVTPLFHVYAVAMGLYLAAHARGTLVVLPRYQPEAVFETIARERITLLAASPTVLVGLLASDAFARADLASVRLVTSGAAALPEATLRRWEDATDCPIVEGYGQSEAGPVLAYNPRVGVRKIGTVGVALPRTQIEIVDFATGRVPQATGAEGEIRVRGPQLMRGYRGRAEETAAALRDGWLYTGDIGAFDADGYLRICGRRMEMAIVSGFNVYPREVEDALCAHPDVREAAVVAVPDAYRGEALVASVVAADAVAIDPGALLAWLAERLVRYKVPQAIRVVDALPKTGIGKVDKTALRAEATKLSIGLRAASLRERQAAIAQLEAVARPATRAGQNRRMKTVRIRPGKERSLLRRHPWVFEGSVAGGKADSGETVRVEAADGRFLAWAAYSPLSSIRLRAWSFDESERIDAAFFARRIAAAVAMRVRLAVASDAVRLVHGEADGLPGLVVDRYGETLSAQFLAAGVERWKKAIADALLATTGAARLFERSDTSAREREGLPPASGWLRAGGDAAAAATVVEIREHGWRFSLDVATGHKTGFYLDQRDNRKLFADAVRRFAVERVLNCYCYTGGFSVAALAGGAKHVMAIDSSAPALVRAEANVVRNGFDPARHEAIDADVNERLRALLDAGRSFDAIVLDPPKLAPTVAHAERAARAYKDINRLALMLLAPGGLLFTFSCSGGIDAGLFHKIVAGAGIDANVDGFVHARLGAAPDHPTTINFPEGEYLKGLAIVKR